MGKKIEVHVRCEFFRNGLCSEEGCNAATRNRLNSSSCCTDKTNGCYFYVYHCPRNLFSRTSADGSEFMALVDDDEWPTKAKNPNILFVNKKKQNRKKQG